MGFFYLKIFQMIVFKVSNNDDSILEVNFCDKGLYIEILNHEHLANIILTNDEVQQFINFLKEHNERLD